MQNKPNFKNAQMNVNYFETKDYEKISNSTLGENKPNSNPICIKPKTDVSSLVTKDYEAKCV